MEPQTTQRPPDRVDEPEFIDLTAWMKTIRTHRKAFAIAAAVSLVVGVVVALLIPKQYTAEASILPSEGPSTVSQLLSQFGGAAMSGLGGKQSMTDLYPQIAGSRTVLTEMLNAPYRDSTFRAALIREYDMSGDSGAKREDNLLRTLNNRLSVSVDPTSNFIRVQFTTYDPALAAAVVNQILHKMDDFLRHRLRTESRDESDLITRRLAQESDSLRIAEDRLLAFQERNRAMDLSPTAVIEQGRLMRQVDIHNALYIELRKQLEIARINEYRTAPVLTVLDWATPPTKKSKPKRSLYVLGFLFVGLAGTLVTLKVRDGKGAKGGISS